MDVTSNLDSLKRQSKEGERLCHLFGEQHQTHLLTLISRYLDLDPDHRLLFTGEGREGFISVLKKKFSLLQPVTWVKEGDEEGLAFSCTRSGGCFPQERTALFDRALFINAVQFYENPSKILKHILNAMGESGKMLLVHRPGSMTTLPLFEKAKKKLAEQDHCLTEILESLRKLGADVKWEIEHVPVIIDKNGWLSLVGTRCLPLPEVLSDYEVDTGLLELRHGCLKYTVRPPDIYLCKQFHDRM
ncbi:uncharacterized protein LOC106703334 [Latimeria chalumnae]|uniref:uncharacterized protein LOC106703334 n=1 Tax=Latimeria chalumnae TaxID=7897 RepID=UPI00313A8688